MEVHHHTHSARKKWTHYFWEFLMLFLAVFCGFLAEYQLEHTIEKQREKQYMQTLIYDLQSDTALLNEGFDRKDGRVIAIDSIFLFFEINPDVEKIPGRVYRHMRRTLWDRTYRRNGTTMDQLKNAGGMRLIRKRIVRDTIAAYELLWQRAEFWREVYMHNQEKSQYLIAKVIVAKDLVAEYRKNPLAGNLAANVIDSLTVQIDINELNEYLNFLHDLKTMTKQDKGFYQGIEQKAEKLIELIKKEYHIE